MRNISFSLTESRVRDRSKTVTRRSGWRLLRPGERLNACVKCMGLKKGEKIQKICVIEVVSAIQVRLSDIDENDCIREGFPDMSPQEFVDFFCKEMKCKPEAIVTRIEFKYVSPKEST